MNIQRKIAKVFRSVSKVIERKHYVEFVTAALSIPVLLTVILVNLNNLKQTKNTTPTPTPQTREIIIRDNLGNTKTVQPTDIPICKKEIGPISISYPKEGETVTDNPVNFIIKYDNENYCSIVWSYRINGGSWSEYSSNSPSVYNLPNGNVKFELRLQSTASSNQDQLERNFTYSGSSVTSIPTQTVSPTPNL